MRLLILDQFSDPGGAQQCLLELLPALRERGWEAIVGLPGTGELFGRIRALGFRAERIRCGPYRSGSKSLADGARFALDTPLLASQIRHLAREIRADLVYVNGPRVLPAAALARLAVPLVFHSHSYVGAGMVRRLAGIALRRTRAWMIGSCRFVAQAWQDFVAPDRQAIIYNGVAGPPDLRGLQAHAPTVACMGRIAPEKGQREFVAAASLIRRSRPDCRLVAYGAALFADAGAQQYDAEVRAAGALSGVEFPGWTTDIYAALAGIDVLLVPSAGHEATTRVILEGHAAGVPVVAFRSGGIPEVVDHGRDGFLVESVEEMAGAALDILNRSREERSALSLAGRESWLRSFTLRRYREDVIAFLERAGGRVCSQDQKTGR